MHDHFWVHLQALDTRSGSDVSFLSYATEGGVEEVKVYIESSK